MESLLYWPTTSEQGARPGVQWIYPVSLGKVVFIYVSNSKPSLERLHGPSVPAVCLWHLFFSPSLMTM